MDIGDILSSLSADDIKSLQNIASSLSGSMQNDSQNFNVPEMSSSVNGVAPKEQSHQTPQTSPSGSNSGLGGMGSLGDIAEIMSKLSSSGNDPRCQLIAALKPMLSPEKQQRADEAVRILKLLDLLPVLKDSGILKGVLGQ